MKFEQEISLIAQRKKSDKVLVNSRMWNKAGAVLVVMVVMVGKSFSENRERSLRTEASNFVDSEEGSRRS